MASQTGHQIILTHILSNISRIKSIQTTKFVQLIEYNIRNIFLDRSNTKCDLEAGLRPFSYKIKIEYISGSTD